MTSEEIRERAFNIASQARALGRDITAGKIEAFVHEACAEFRASLMEMTEIYRDGVPMNLEPLCIQRALKVIGQGPAH